MADRPLTPLGLPELSALAVRSRPAGRELVAASDERLELVLAPLGDDGSPGRPRRRSLASLLPERLRGDGGGSEFEGVACDGAGRVVLLQEESARALVLSPGLRSVQREIDLVVNAGMAGVGAAWARDRNARGEGILLMRDGHLLVAKQRDPAGLVEFGPPGDEPLGVGADTLLGADQELALPARPPRGRAAAYAALAWWELDAAGEGPFESVNDLAATPDGRVQLLSSSSGRIGRLERTVRPGDGRARLRRSRALPRDEGGGRAEALAPAPGGRFIVGYDDRAGGALWLLDPWG